MVCHAINTFLAYFVNGYIHFISCKYTRRHQNEDTNIISICQHFCILSKLKDYSALLQPAVSNPQLKKLRLYVSHIYISHPSRKFSGDFGCQDSFLSTIFTFIFGTFAK